MSELSQALQNARSMRDIYDALIAAVKDGADTSISMLKDATNGLASIKTAASSASNNAADAKAALADATNGLAAIKTAITAIPTTAPATPTNVSDAQTAIIAAVQANVGVPTLTIPSTTASQELAPNTLYVFAERTSDLTLTLGTPITGIANEYHCFVVTGSTAPTITWPTGISWNGGSAPTIAADKTYEISILNNVAAYFEV